MRKHLGLERFKGYVRMVCNVNEDIRTGKLTLAAARRIIDEKGRDSAGNVFAECDEVIVDGKVQFDVKKKYVIRYMLK